MTSPTNKLIILAGPSASGKTSVAKYLLANVKGLAFSISATTRARRENEVDGEDYHFLSLENFKEKIKTDAFVEYEQVYEGLYYGTLKSEIESIWKRNLTPVLDIDVVGAMNIKDNIYPQAFTIFIHPVSIDNVLLRLKQRKTESSESFSKRISKVEEELSFHPRFDAVVYNEDLQEACLFAEKLVTEYLSK